MQHHWLEYVSWSANGVLAIVAILALWQVYAAIQQAKHSLAQTKLLLEQVEVSRQDIILRSRREALALALDQCKRFAESIVPHFDIVQGKMMAKGFTPPANVQPDFPYLPQEQSTGQIWHKETELRKEIIHALNELESFAMYFACDLADEQIAFTPTAQTFCGICHYHAGFIGVFRQENKIKLYQNLVKLYGIWNPRLERTVFEEQSKTLEQKMKNLPADRKGAPIGTQI